MSYLGKLFGTEKALSSIVDGVSNGLDALVYTDEEKASGAAKERSEARKMVIEWMSATQGQNLARRILALSIGGLWILMILTSTLLSICSVFVDNIGVVTADKFKEASSIAKSTAFDMGPAVMLILAFYFAAPHMGDIAKAVTGKFSKSVNKG